MRSIRILDEATEEAVAAAAWYERQQPGLGTDFAAAIEAAVDLIEEDFIPLSPMPEQAEESDVVVLELPEESVVVAIAHHARKPGYWRNRPL